MAPSSDARTMTFVPVTFTPPEPERVVLENGIVVYLLEDHELPLVTINAIIRAGSWLDSQDTVGLAALTGAVMRTGGTATMSPDQVDAELERMAAAIGIGMGVESGSASLDVLKKDLPAGLKIFADLLRHPAFDPARLELAKLQSIEGIRRRQDQPQPIASREFAKMIYGPTHPFARESSVESISRITREDVVAFHQRVLHPNGLMLGITGDFNTTEMLALLRATFGEWQPGAVPVVALPAINGNESVAGKALVRYVGKTTSQTHVRVGHLTLKEQDPDYPAFTLLNDILGGGLFRSRLFQDVRTKRGLAYSVGSGLRTGTHEQGLWAMRAETKLASTQEVIDRFVANMERLRVEPVTDAELAEAKEAYVNSFIFSFVSPSMIVARLMGLEYDGLPKDFLQRAREKVVSVTKAELLQVANRHFHPDRLRILAVGPQETVVPALATFGEVQEIKLPMER
jgi:predicted Zn-dependent peptidase